MSEHTFVDITRRDTERYLLIAVDASENSKRAVMFLANFFGNDKDVYITILSIIPERSEDYFVKDEEQVRWVAEKKAEMHDVFVVYKNILLDAGFQESQLDIRLIVRHCESIGEAILEEQDKLHCCIVVVGRRGISHREESVLGSTSSRILHYAKNCAVMVVE